MQHSILQVHTHTLHTRRIRTCTACKATHILYRHPPVRPAETPPIGPVQSPRRLQTPSRTISTDNQAYCLYTHPRPVQAASRTAYQDTHRYGHSPVRHVQTSTYTSYTDTGPCGTYKHRPRQHLWIFTRTASVEIHLYGLYRNSPVRPAQILACTANGVAHQYRAFRHISVRGYIHPPIQSVRHPSVR